MFATDIVYSIFYFRSIIRVLSVQVNLNKHHQSNFPRRGYKYLRHCIQICRHLIFLSIGKTLQQKDVGFLLVQQQQ